MNIQNSLTNLEALLQPICTANNWRFQYYIDTLEKSARTWQREVLLLNFTGANFQQPKTAQRRKVDCSILQQPITYSYEIVLHTKNLKTPESYTQLEDLVDVISGKYIIDRAGPLYVKDIQFRTIDGPSCFVLYGITCACELIEQFGDCVC